MSTEIRANFVVSQDNHLVNAKYSDPLTKNEMKIVLGMISYIQPSDKDLKEYEMKLTSFAKLLGMKEFSNYSYFEKITENLLRRVIVIKDGNKTIQTHWVSSCTYVKGQGTISFKFDPDLKPYLLNLQSFTKYQLSNILNLDSFYSIRLYEIMKQNEYKPKAFEIHVDDLRLYLGATKPTFKQYAQFKRTILSRAIAEINEKTDILITFEEIKEGRKVIKLLFTVKKKKGKRITEPPAEEKKPPSKPTSNLSVLEQANYYHFEFTLELISDERVEKTTLYRLYQSALKVWDFDFNRTYQELICISTYAYQTESIKNKIGFLITKINESAEIKNSLGSAPSFFEFSANFAILIKPKNEFVQAIEAKLEEILPREFFETKQMYIEYRIKKRFIELNERFVQLTELQNELLKNQSMDSYNIVLNEIQNMMAERSYLIELQQTEIQEEDIERIEQELSTKLFDPAEIQLEPAKKVNEPPQEQPTEEVVGEDVEAIRKEIRDLLFNKEFQKERYEALRKKLDELEKDKIF